ncbi:MAG: carbohydrate binding domain-containing protein [Verrucomicrobia bacterium]|nr:carbohydrate binding domain-containing protein [Verrucomicrobiota bacterium]
MKTSLADCRILSHAERRATGGLGRPARFPAFHRPSCAALACAVLLAAGSFPVLADPIIVNGDFESGAMAPWSNGMSPASPAPVAAAARSGQYGLEVTGLGPPALISQEIQARLTAGPVYRFSAWIKLLEVSSSPGLPPIYIPHLSIYLGTDFFSPAVIAHAINAVGQGWQKLEVSRSFTSTELQGTVRLEVGGLAKFQMDDVAGGTAPLTGYEAWVQANFTPAEQGLGLAHPAADPDGCGVANLLRYGLGLSSRNPELSMLPRLTPSSANPAKSAFEFHLPAPPPTDVAYFFGVSNDLQAWNEAALAGLNPEFDQTYTTGPLTNRRLIRVVAPDPAPGQTRLFMTLVVRQTAGSP